MAERETKKCIPNIRVLMVLLLLFFSGVSAVVLVASVGSLRYVNCALGV